MSHDKSESGFVYFVSAYHMVPCGYFKVGITRKESHKKRINQIQCISPFHVMPICVVKHSTPEDLEYSILSDSYEFERKVYSYMTSKCDIGVVL